MGLRGVLSHADQSVAVRASRLTGGVLSLSPLQASAVSVSRQLSRLAFLDHPSPSLISELRASPWILGLLLVFYRVRSWNDVVTESLKNGGRRIILTIDK